MTAEKCAVCGTDSKGNIQYNASDYDCPNCGVFSIEDGAKRRMTYFYEKDSGRTSALLSHIIWKGQGGKEPFYVNYDMVETAHTLNFPSPGERLNLLILHVGDELRDLPGERVKTSAENLRAKIAAILPTDVNYISQEGVELKLFADPSGGKLRLTMQGWERYGELKKGLTDSNKAFMAMAFTDNEETVEMFENFFRPAVEQTGFDLQRVTDTQKPGLIDDKIRVDIRMSKFVVADLTKKNNGAYFEAGFAEGLGKPVIYTCQHDFFHNREAGGTHFDCNHHMTIQWELSRAAEAAEQLKATIRNTFPAEARMTD